MRVPFADLKVQYAELASDIGAAMDEVLASTEFVGGRASRAFEAAFAAAMGTEHCVGVGNGTDALVVALKAVGIDRGDSVATAANSFIASSEAITLAGGTPVFVDCADDYTMSAPELEVALERAAARGRPIRAIIPVHLYGRACDMTAIGALAKKHSAVIIEDCAQAHLAQHRGQSVGSFGAAGSFSFYPGKNLGAYGDGGALVSNDAALAERMRMMANHGRKDKYDHQFEGLNSRLDNLQAAVLGVKLPHLARWTRQRIDAAAWYRQHLQGTEGVVLPAPAAGLEHVYHLFVVRVERRDEVRSLLADAGIDTGVHYPAALPNLTAYGHLGHARSDFPRASALESTILSLPMFPEISEAQVAWVAETLRRAVER